MDYNGVNKPLSTTICVSASVEPGRWIFINMLGKDEVIPMVRSAHYLRAALPFFICLGFPGCKSETNNRGMSRSSAADLPNDDDVQRAPIAEQTQTPTDTNPVIRKPKCRTYETHIKPFMDENCVSCHGAGSKSGNLSTYAQVAANVDTIVASIASARMPPGSQGPAAYQKELEFLEEWHGNGALQNVSQCDQTPDASSNGGAATGSSTGIDNGTTTGRDNAVGGGPNEGTDGGT